LSACSRTIEITNRRGLHARASAKFVTMAAEMATVRAGPSPDPVFKNGSAGDIATSQ